ncbi:MAG: hypothetical protein ACTS4W_00300 [Candidatus Hodgkinia cicadicola]
MNIDLYLRDIAREQIIKREVNMIGFNEMQLNVKLGRTILSFVNLLTSTCLKINNERFMFLNQRTCLVKPKVIEIWTKWHD